MGVKWKKELLYPNICTNCGGSKSRSKSNWCKKCSIKLQRRVGPKWEKGKSPMQGKKHSLETRQKMSNAILRGAIRGEKHYKWKGDQVSYRNLHRWVERKLGKANKCMKNLTHKSTRYHWANISKEYKRDLSDWTQMCPSCNCKDRIERRVSP